MNKLIKVKTLLSYISIYSILVFCSCNKGYITGGNLEDTEQYKNFTTYDVIKQLPNLDTLVQLIDAAGIKDQINAQGTTFFAVPDQTISGYLIAKTFYLKNNVSGNAEYSLDSLLTALKNNTNGLKDSLLMYLVKTNATPSSLNAIGTKFSTGFSNDSVIISYEPTLDPTLGYSTIVTTQPRVMYLTNLWGAFYNLSKDSTAADIPASQGTRTLVKTAFINTQNGVLNVLQPGIATINGDYSSITISNNLLFCYGSNTDDN